MYIQEKVEIFEALAHKNRIEIVEKLRFGDKLSINHLSKGASISRQGISKHLRILESSGLIKSSKFGRETIFELQFERFRVASEYFRAVENYWEEKLQNLKSFIEL